MPKQKQPGFSMLELLICLAVFGVILSLVGGYLLISYRLTEDTTIANRVNSISEDLANRFARQQIPAPQTGYIIVDHNGSWVLDREGDGKRYDYEVKLTRLENRNVYVLVNLRSGSRIFSSASALYVLP